MKKNIFFLMLVLQIFIQPVAFAWQNDLKDLMQNDKSVIYALIIRTFNAHDLNGDELIQDKKGESRGNFLNATYRLDELKSLGINTIHLLPITSIGKQKALGTAGSVYSLLSFDTINPELDAKFNNLSVEQEAKIFVDECHKRGIRVMLDLPSCGSYDLFLLKPELFELDKNDQPVQVLDWSDVRLYKSWADIDKKILNKALLDEHKKFIDLCLRLGIDGVRTDVAALKPKLFWEELIKYARAKDPHFAFLAESSDSWRTPISKVAPYTQPEDLLAAGYDTYYGSYMNTYSWKNASEINKHVLFNLKLTSSYKEKKSVIGSFATYDMASPVSIGGVALSKFITVLQTTLPKVNPYFVSGFETGDEYNYRYTNKPADKTYTDCNKYFVHTGRLDMFNYSRSPVGNYPEIAGFMRECLSFRAKNINLITKGKYIPISCANNKILMYKRQYNDKSVLIIANQDYKKTQSFTYPINQNLASKVIINSEDNLDFSISKKGTFIKLLPSQSLIINLN